ncbi:RNase H domain-containing protein [Trichonephila clavipes]|nr:RNase H domain-containing protein [Trichonephila clavipes]
MARNRTVIYMVLRAACKNKRYLTYLAPKNFWIPSHVFLICNGIVNELAKGDTATTQIHKELLTNLELYSKCNTSIKISWKPSSPHLWYLSQCSGALVNFKSEKRDQITFARLSTGLLKSLRFSHGAKTFPICTKCNDAEATPQHLLDYERTATAGSDVVQSGRPIFDDFFQHLWPYIGNNTANVVLKMVKRLWLIRIDQSLYIAPQKIV